MKTTNRVQRNGATKPVKSQAKIQTASAPAEFKIVRLRECPVDNPKIDAPPEVVDFWREHVVSAPWYKDDKECLCVFLLNTRHRLLGFDLISQGTKDTILMHPSEVLRLAAIKNAAAIIIAHNHPSGDPTPSEPDVKVTRDLIRAAQYLKIELLDSIIIGDARREKSFTSLRELGYFYSNDSGPVPVSAAVSDSKLSSVGLDAIDALDLLKDCAAAGIALAMMNANNIKDCTSANAGWEVFDSATFQAGNLELPRVLASQFESDLSAWRAEVDRMVQKTTLTEMPKAGPRFPSHNTEDAVNALKHLIDLQGAEISNRNNNGAFAASFIIMARLEAAFDKAWEAYGALQRPLGGLKIPQAA
jgi:DNA repair protein RadC